MEAALGVGDDRDRYRVDDRARLLGELRKRKRAGVGQAEAAGGGGVATDVDTVEAVRLDQLRRQRVGRADRGNRTARGDQAPQSLASGGKNNSGSVPEFRL
jgi:hypothetical protein